MGGRDGRRSPTVPLTLVASVTSIRGDLLFSGQLRVDGRITGDVTAEPVADSEIHVGPEGRIEGRVTVARLVVEGTVLGPVAARERLELRSGGRLAGEIGYRDLQIEHGACIEGSLAALDVDGARIEAPLRLSARRRDE
jgi:cytoskeletal protein CcmA (bactofilin family)